MQLAIEEPSARGTQSSVAPSDVTLKTSEELSNIISQFVLSDGWMDRVRLNSEQRWYERLHHNSEYDIWVISWMPGQSTGFHDHGESSVAFIVTTGVLEEHRPNEQSLAIHLGQPRSFNPAYAHDVRNTSGAPAVSIHAYSPPLSEMNEYELAGSRLVPRERASERAEKLKEQKHARKGEPVNHIRARTIDQVLSAARSRLRRLPPDEACEAVTEAEAILIDIRPEGQRAIEGSIPGALIVERNVLEWRLDPAFSSRLPIATHDIQVIVFCSEGYTSSLAAAALQYIGLWRATDLVGGFNAWRAMGLPIEPTSFYPSQY